MTAYEAESSANTLSGNASVGGCDECSGAKKVGGLYLGGAVRFNDIVVDTAGTYLLNVAYTSGDPRSVKVSANGKPAATWDFPSSGGWGAAATISVPVTLKAGSNTVTLDSGPSGYSPDIDKIDVPRRS